MRMAGIRLLQHLFIRGSEKDGCSGMRIEGDIC